MYIYIYIHITRIYKMPFQESMAKETWLHLILVTVTNFQIMCRRCHFGTENLTGIQAAFSMHVCAA